VSALSGEPLLTLPARGTLPWCRKQLAAKLGAEPFAVQLVKPRSLRAFTEGSFEVAPECAVLLSSRYAVRCFRCQAIVRCSCSRQPERRCSCVPSLHREPLEACCDCEEAWPPAS
jgi:hypothetical protein